MITPDVVDPRQTITDSPCSLVPAATAPGSRRPLSEVVSRNTIYPIIHDHKFNYDLLKEFGVKELKINIYYFSTQIQIKLSISWKIIYI